jgi:hypothetical protein
LNISTHPAGREVYANECYFDCSNGMNNYSTNTIVTFSGPTESVISNCYFKGKLRVENNAWAVIDGIVQNCVVNIDFTPKDSTVNTLKICNTDIAL